MDQNGWFIAGGNELSGNELISDWFALSHDV